MAARLKASVRDDETACRFGGDEFVVLLSDCEGEDVAGVIVERISARLSEAYDLDGMPLELTASTRDRPVRRQRASVLGILSYRKCKV